MEEYKCINYDRCGGMVFFSDKEKEFFASKGFDKPKRCKKCLQEKRSQERH